MKELIVHIVISSLAFLVLGFLSGFVISRIIPTSLPPVCSEWNKNHVMEMSLILAGIMYGVISYIVARKFAVESKQ